jgi:hypothetical protein
MKIAELTFTLFNEYKKTSFFGGGSGGAFVPCVA